MAIEGSIPVPPVRTRIRYGLDEEERNVADVGKKRPRDGRDSYVEAPAGAPGHSNLDEEGGLN
jgi:hypothetical protein